VRSTWKRWYSLVQLCIVPLNLSHDKIDEHVVLTQLQFYLCKIPDIVTNWQLGTLLSQQEIYKQPINYKHTLAILNSFLILHRLEENYFKN
jgi:hypothetical protein